MIRLGDHPFAKNDEGRLKSRIATVFLRTPGLVTTPGIHATQRALWVEELNRRRQAAGRPALTPAEAEAEWSESVDLILEPEAILIRPDPEAMPLAFRADELLQELTSKNRIRFLYVSDQTVREALRARGENWRMNPLPRTAEDMEAMIRSSRLALGGGALYYYNRLTGTRYVTCATFRELARLDDEALRRTLLEIQTHCRRRNRVGSPEIDFFLSGSDFGEADFAPLDLETLEGPALRALHARLAARFDRAVPPLLREDDSGDIEWRNRMFAALLGQRDEAISEEILVGLSPEFYLQIEWLPGGRIEEGELIFDSMFDDFDRAPANPELRRLCDLRARSFILNYIREYGDIEYANIGRINRSLSKRVQAGERRHNVYMAQVKRVGQPDPVVHILRVQKRGVPEFLEAGRDLFSAVMESEAYVDDVLDRRLGCRQLGMNLPPRVVSRRIQERYDGPVAASTGAVYWLTCFERDYIDGRATDKMSLASLRDPVFAIRLAGLLGEAAAPNLIVGCKRSDGEVLFDQGDEIVVFDFRGLPSRLFVADHTGTFADTESPFEDAAAAYAEAVNSRLDRVPDPAAFAKAFAQAFRLEFGRIQGEYRRHRRAFRALFRYRPRDTEGSFPVRWERVLDRLEAADPDGVTAAIQGQMNL